MSAVASAIGHRDRGRIAFRALVLALSAAAWCVLALWSASPYARYVDHGRWGDAAVLATLCSALPGGGIWLPAVLYVCAWLLMIAAMMLPTTLPVLEAVRRLTLGLPRQRRLLALAVLGYVLAWTAFGAAAHAADLLVQVALRTTPWFVAHGYALGAGVIALAGLFQFSALKYRCLEACHTPLAFVLQRWHGTRRAKDALQVGFDHGLFCVGCCWALMLIMFVVGTASIGWMMALAAVMAAEKNLPQGRRLRAPLGCLLIGGAAGIVLLHAVPA